MSLRHRRFLALVAGLAVTASAARAEITPEAKQVVDRYIAAIGGEKVVTSAQTARIESSIRAMGFAGTTTTYAVRPNKHASETLLGPFKILDGFDGTIGWRTEPSGKVVMLDGKDLEDSKASGIFENELWLLPDQGGCKVAVTGTEKDSAGTYTVVEVTPPAGRPRSFWFDPKSGLINRSTSKHDNLTIVVTQSDYRQAAGRLMSFRSHQIIVEMPANTADMVVDSVVVNEPVSDARFQPPAAPAAGGPQYLKIPGTAVLPFRYSARHVWLKASVNGRDVEDFIYDTGASITVLDSTYAARLGLQVQGKMQAQGAGRSGNAGFAKLQSLQVAASDGDGVEIHDVRVAVLAINRDIAPFFWRDIAGIIGYDFISRFVNEIDFDAGTITLRDPKTFSYGGAGKAIPFTLAGTVPTVPMTIDGKYTGNFRLDVGSSGTVDLHGPFAKRNGIGKAGKAIEVTSGGFGGTFTSRLIRMEKIALGPYSWDYPIVSISGATSGALSSEDYAGNVGNRILERFRCTFDYEHRTLYLEPGKRYPMPDRLDRAGVQMARYGDVVKAMQVIKGSPAAQAGIKEGDQVVSIDGKPILAYTLEVLEVLFEQSAAGRKIVFEIDRAGTLTKIPVTLGTVL